MTALPDAATVDLPVRADDQPSDARVSQGKSGKLKIVKGPGNSINGKEG